MLPNGQNASSIRMQRKENCLNLGSKDRADTEAQDYTHMHAAPSRREGGGGGGALGEIEANGDKWVYHN